MERDDGGGNSTDGSAGEGDARGAQGHDRGSRFELRRTADGSRTLFDRAAGQTFHSERGARSETEHVFVRGSGVLERLRPNATVHVVEIGLGSGANLLATWQAARRVGALLAYRTVELRPPPVKVVRALDLAADLEDETMLKAWLAVLDALQPTTAALPSAYHSFDVANDLQLEVAIGNAASGPDGTPSTEAARILEPGWADAIYHDAFSRDATPELWSEPFLAACARALAPGGAWVSYSVAGDVRRRLEAAGLTVRKRPGPPGGKKEMLRAERSAGD